MLGAEADRLLKSDVQIWRYYIFDGMNQSPWREPRKQVCQVYFPTMKKSMPFRSRFFFFKKDRGNIYLKGNSTVHRTKATFILLRDMLQVQTIWNSYFSVFQKETFQLLLFTISHFRLCLLYLAIKFPFFTLVKTIGIHKITIFNLVASEDFLPSNLSILNILGKYRFVVFKSHSISKSVFPYTKVEVISTYLVFLP